MMYNKKELSAMLRIAETMGWNKKPVVEVMKTITMMVNNQQSVEMDCVGECDDFSTTLERISQFDGENIITCLHVYDYTSLIAWEVMRTSDIFGMSVWDFYNLQNWLDNKDNILAAIDEEEDEFIQIDEELWTADYHSNMMAIGWE